MLSSGLNGIRHMNSPKQAWNISSTVSPTLAINERVKSMWAAKRPVFHLGFGESRMPLHPLLTTALRENANKRSYLETAGLFELREAVAGFYKRYWNLNFIPDQIIVGPGSKSLLFGIFLGLECDVYLPTPSWVSYRPQAELAGRQITYLKSCFESEYEITVEALEAALNEYGTGRIPLLILNSPNNPSGKVLTESKLIELAEFCRSRQIVVVSDEIYSLTTFDGQSHSSIAEHYPEGTIIVGGPSKHLSLGGWRLGTAIFPDSSLGKIAVDALKTVASEIWSSPTSAIQYAAIQAYAENDEISGYIRTCTELHEIKTRLLANKFSQMRVECTHPEGGFYFVANFDLWRDSLYRMGISTSLQLTNHLLNQFEIATLPGSVFGIHQNELSIRIASSYIDMETEVKARKLMSTFMSNGRGLNRDDLSNSFAAIKRMKSFVDSLDEYRGHY